MNTEVTRKNMVGTITPAIYNSMVDKYMAKDHADVRRWFQHFTPLQAIQVAATLGHYIQDRFGAAELGEYFTWLTNISN